MLRTNLSTRPFYNERLVHVVLGLVAVVILAVTLVNLIRLVSLSRQNTTLSARIREDRTAADELSRKARQTRQNIDPDELKVVAAAAREANALIDSRTFSWTEFLNHIEATLPPDVMLASVRPSIEENGTKITLGVVARRSVDIDEFIEQLEATGAFDRGLARQLATNDNGLLQATVEIMYTPAAAGPRAPAAATPKPGAGPGKGASR
jgi:type IV pilus assembly protein PilN